MKNKRLRLLLPALLLLITSALPGWSTGAPMDYPLDNCRDGAFSTEEDFRMMEGEPYDGNPIISDGDLLSPGGQVCARNADLLSAFEPALLPDLGLDAVHIIDFERLLVAFSTELDDPFGRFSAGDLLFTNGGIIPNLALVARFDLGYDIGLDAVQLVGEPDHITAFADLAAQLSPQDWLLDERLQAELERRQIDLWFSTEGTAPSVESPAFLDGDLLSASGFIVQANSDLLPPGVPAGLPNRGVDFGLDAVALRAGAAQERLLYSTEILHRAEDALSFTDGDVLAAGNGVVMPNQALIANFHPAANFLGLDALWHGRTAPNRPELQWMCSESVWNFDGNGLFYEGLSTGAPQDPRRPCGWYVPFNGFLPAGAAEFRVAFRAAGDPDPGPGLASAIHTEWKIQERILGICQYADPPLTLTPDGDGWFDASLYRGYKDGSLTGNCTNPGLVLAVWDTNNEKGWPNPPPNKDGHYVVWLEWRNAPAGPAIREPVEHHIQLDNTRPEITTLELKYFDGVTDVDVGACGDAPTGQHIFKVYGDFFDQYYLGYRLRVRGGDPPASAWYPASPWPNWLDYWHKYYNDGNGHTGSAGTTPAGVQFLQEVDMHDLGVSFTDCCYVLDLWVSDAALRHNFDHEKVWPAQPAWAWPNDFLTFAARPLP